MNIINHFLRLNLFQKTALITVAATFFLILVGSLVRVSGAGLGCPDWPKCYGLWIPPTTVDAVPEGYNAEEFNAVKTWTEYVNRLVGVVIGLLITATLIFSLKYIKTKPVLFKGSFLAFVLVLFQGWLGGQVVRSGLAEGMITIHMIVALIIVNVLLFVSFAGIKEHYDFYLDQAKKKKLIQIASILVFITLLQVVLGTQVREAIDSVKFAFPEMPKSEWVDNLGWIDQIHRSFSWIVLIVGIYLHRFIKKTEASALFTKLSIVVLSFIAIQFITGVGMVYFGMPGSFQVIHLVIACLMVGAQFLIILAARESKPLIK